MRGQPWTSGLHMIRISLVRLASEVFPQMPRRRGPGTSWQNRWDRQKRSDCSKAWSAANDDPAKEAAGELYCIRALMGSIVTAAFARMPSCVAVLRPETFLGFGRRVSNYPFNRIA